MATLLDTAFAEARKLPAADQEALASLILEELRDRAAWDAAFEASQNDLAALADEALAEFGRGATRPLDGQDS